MALVTVITRHIGTAADRAALSTTALTAGSLFLETDTILTYIWDGSAWNLQ